MERCRQSRQIANERQESAGTKHLSAALGRAEHAHLVEALRQTALDHTWRDLFRQKSFKELLVKGADLVQSRLQFRRRIHQNVVEGRQLLSDYF